MVVRSTKSSARSDQGDATAAQEATGDAPVHQDAKPGIWTGTVLLLSGASQMGKSYLTNLVLVRERGAVGRRIDLAYTQAVTEAGMAPPQPSRGQQKVSQKEARRHARNRKFPSAAARDKFFACIERVVRTAMEEGKSAGVLVVLDGGTLRKPDEIDIVHRCAQEVFGPTARLLRVNVRAPYQQWLQNRVSRMLKSRLEMAPVQKLSVEHYNSEIEREIPKPDPRIEDYHVQGPEDLRRLLTDLQRGRAE